MLWLCDFAYHGHGTLSPWSDRAEMGGTHCTCNNMLCFATCFCLCQHLMICLHLCQYSVVLLYPSPWDFHLFLWGTMYLTSFTAVSMAKVISNAFMKSTSGYKSSLCWIWRSFTPLMGISSSTSFRASLYSQWVAKCLSLATNAAMDSLCFLDLVLILNLRTVTTSLGCSAFSPNWQYHYSWVMHGPWVYPGLRQVCRCWKHKPLVVLLLSSCL